MSCVVFGAVVCLRTLRKQLIIERGNARDFVAVFLILSVELVCQLSRTQVKRKLADPVVVKILNNIGIGRRILRGHKTSESDYHKQKYRCRNSKVDQQSFGFFKFQ